MFNRQEQKKIEAEALRQWQDQQRLLLRHAQRQVGWVIETSRWPFPLTADDLTFLKINRISAT